MDVLVKWEDGSENVVSTKDLKIVDGSKVFKRKKKVKMLYNGKTYFGTILATDASGDEGSSIDSPPTPNSDVDLRSNSSDDIPLGKMKEKLHLEPLKSPTIYSTKQKFIDSGSEESLFSGDDTDKDPDFVVDECSAKKCQKMGVGKCDVLLCKNIVCEKHDLCRLHCELISSVNEESYKKKTGKKRKKTPQNKVISVQQPNTDQYNSAQTCEHPDCSTEIFSTCDCLQILLCYDHFVAENNCQYHFVNNMNTEILFPVEGSTEKLRLEK